MPTDFPPDPNGSPDEIAALVRILHETEQRLAELTGGEVDAVLHPAGTAYLLRSAQEKLRLSEFSQRHLADTQIAILNALPAHIALLNSEGVIVAVNDSWRRFASANVLQSQDFFVGQNYLTVCENAQGECSQEARETAQGIRRVLRGETAEFGLEYPCHSPTEKRWFRLMVTPLSGNPISGAVVMHLNVTHRRLADETLRKSEQEQRQLATRLEAEARRLRESQAVANVGSWETDLATLEVTWTDETFRIFETNPDQFQPTHQAFLELVHPEDRTRVDDAFRASIGAPGLFEIEHRLLLPGEKIKHVEERWQTFTDDSGKPLRAIGTCQDITKQVTARAALVQSEERFRRLYEHVPDAIQLIDSRGVILDINPATEKITGYPRTELIGQNFLKLNMLRGEHVFRAQEAFMRNAQGHGTGPAEYAVHRKDGQVITMEFEGFPILIGHQSLILGVGRDVTARKRSEERLVRISRLYMVLSHVNEMIVRTAEPSQLLSGACRIAVDNGGFRMAAIVGIDAATGVINDLAHAGAEDGYFSEVSFNLSDPSLNRGTIGTAIRTGRYDVCNDTATDPRMTAWREIMLRHGYRSTASFPIQERRKVIGVLVLFSEEVNIFQEEEVNLLTAVTEDVSYAIEALRSAKSLRERQMHLSSAERMGGMGTWNVDLESGRLVWSEATCELFGIRPAEFQETFEHFFSFILPEDRPVYDACLGRVTVDNPFIEAEYRIRRADGQVRWMYERGNVEFEAGGRQTRRLGMVMDITERKLTEAAIIREREFSRTVLDNIADGVVACDATGKLVLFNQVARNWHGVDASALPAEEWASQYDLFGPDGITPLNRDDVPLYRAYRGEIVRDVEMTILRKGEPPRYIRCDGQAFFDAQHVLLGAAAVMHDITERKREDAESLRASQTLSEIVRIQQEIANANLPLPEMMTLMAERAQFVTGANGAVVELVEQEEMVYKAGSGLMAGTVGARLKMQGSLSGLAVTSEAVLWSDDTETDPRVDLAACRRLGVRSMIVTPLRVGKEIIGVLKTMSAEPGTFSTRDVHNLQILVESLGVVIRRQRAVEALRASMEEFRTLAEAMPQIVWVTRADGWTLYFNQHWMEYTGLTLEESLGHGWIKPFHPEDQQRAWDAWQLATSTVDTYSLECRLRRADGEYRWWLIRGEPQKDTAGNVLKWFGTCTDIHDRKLAELEISRSNRALKMLSACNEALIHADDEDELLQVICEIAASIGGYRMAWVGYAVHDAKRTIRPMAQAGEEEGYLSEARLTWAENTPEGNGPAGRTIRSGQPNVSEDVERDPTFLWRDAARLRGYRSVICLPLRDESGSFGLLGLYSAETFQAGPEEIKLLQELADDLAFGILNLRARLERQRLHEAVLAIGRGVSASVGDEFFDRLNQHLVEALNADAGFIARFSAQDDRVARTVSAFVRGERIENYEYQVAGTPCGSVFEGELCIFEKGVQQRFPSHTLLADLDTESYAGMPLKNSEGKVFGLIAVLFSQPITQRDFIASVLQIFAARATAEMERLRADASVREQAALLDKAQDAIFVRDLEGCITYWNKSAERLYGWTAEQALGSSTRELLYADPAAFDLAMEKLLAEGEWIGEMRKKRKDGRKIMVEARWTLVKDDEGRPRGVLAINTDITERKALEQQFLRAQRMESIGTLAGGIAHDLNNVLGPIIMSLDLLKLRFPDANSRELIDVIGTSAQRGADMVRQVLSFGRGVEGKRIEVQIKLLVKDIERIANDTFLKHVRMTTSIPDDLWDVEGDPTQIHQVLLNLCVNARDAMPNGGTLSISAENVQIDEQYAGLKLEAKPGPHVAIHVEDTGSGMTPEVMDKIFDPFYTTKELGRGTGLGLSTSLAIVKSHGGFIRVYSEPGKGTKFRVYLPAQLTTSGRAVEEIAAQLPRGHGELILVVDDEPSVRQITRQTLEAFGYRALLASDGAEAVAMYAARPHDFAVVLTDMMMPGFDGTATIQVLRKMNPKLPIIAASGLSTEGQVAKAKDLGVKHFLAKPYTAEALLKVLQEILRGKS
jgi:PAS domain S-box-containing protein